MDLHQLEKWISTGFGHLPIPRPKSQKLSACKIVAHRGGLENPSYENTLDAFTKCLDLGIWGIEFDVRWTKDGVPIIHHDPETGRVRAGSSIMNISMNTLAEIRAEHPYIPTLQEVVSRFGKKMHMMIEIKKLDQGQSWDDGKIQTLQTTLKGLEPLKDFHFLTLDHNDLPPVEKLNREFVVPVADVNWQYFLKDRKKYKFNGIGGHFLVMPPYLKLKRLPKAFKVGLGFADNPASLYYCCFQRCDWVFTNTPELLRRTIKGS